MRFEEIAPKWAQSIKNKRIVSAMLRMDMYATCVVGEAHGFRDTKDYREKGPHYGCQVCHDIGNQFSEKILQMDPTDLTLVESYQSLIDNFVEHWNKKHVNG